MTVARRVLSTWPSSSKLVHLSECLCYGIHASRAKSFPVPILIAVIPFTPVFCAPYKCCMIDTDALSQLYDVRVVVFVLFVRAAGVRVSDVGDLQFPSHASPLETSLASHKSFSVCSDASGSLF